ncbi:GCN5 family acetyltransferase [Intrasporangium chromatireducens Q5-1]|uniref:GCN5 family acetyltransferase n=1 Tax=Intrasporangium chromatireducens Q5-1 TaxID=584657 RepID=W9GKL9_9MICO|nr:GNAT family N-acetyltransferase [Intrasporangium chromatireducens]EWT05662.1 GCN5 family acetyltransferase [Intrasporangium chromatireducens Q5-1]
MRIREYRDSDWPEVWPIVEQVIRAGDTFCYDPEQSESEARRLWVTPPPGHVVVALDREELVGTANMYANRPGPGAHIASGNFMVEQASRGAGVGRALVSYLLGWARASGFAGVQFNAVAASNTPAVHLYESLGFTVVGTVPGAFAHPSLGRVGLHVMFCDLTSGTGATAGNR